MLKIVRELAGDNPWVFKIIMGVIALTFVITMGWWGIKAPQQNVLASVNGHDVNAQDYRKAYNRAVAYYREIYKDKFDAEMLEKMKVRDKVLEDLVSRELWIEEAKRKELMIDKVKRFVKDSVAVADEEVNEAFPLNLSGGKDAGTGLKPALTERPAEEMQQLKKFLQFQKQEKAVMAYVAAMRAKGKG